MVHHFSTQVLRISLIFWVLNFESLTSSVERISSRAKGISWAGELTHEKSPPSVRDPKQDSIEKTQASDNSNDASFDDQREASFTAPHRCFSSHLDDSSIVQIEAPAKWRDTLCLQKPNHAAIAALLVDESSILTSHTAKSPSPNSDREERTHLKLAEFTFKGLNLASNLFRTEEPLKKWWELKEKWKQASLISD